MKHGILLLARYNCDNTSLANASEKKILQKWHVHVNYNVTDWMKEIISILMRSYAQSSLAHRAAEFPRIASIFKKV